MSQVDELAVSQAAIVARAADPDEDGVSQANKDLEHWMETHTFGEKVNCIVKNLRAPAHGWRARGLNKEHVDKLQDSFRSGGTKNPNMCAAVIDTNLYERWMSIKLTDSAGGLSDEEVQRWVDEVFPDSNQCRLGMQTAAGEHSRNALLCLQARWPLAPRWRDIWMRVVLCPDTPEAHEMLRVMSVRDNVSCGVVLKSNFYDMVMYTHRLIRNWIRQHPT